MVVLEQVLPGPILQHREGQLPQKTIRAKKERLSPPHQVRDGFPDRGVKLGVEIALARRRESFRPPPCNEIVEEGFRERLDVSGLPEIGELNGGLRMDNPSEYMIPDRIIHQGPSLWNSRNKSFGRGRSHDFVQAKGAIQFAFLGLAFLA